MQEIELEKTYLAKFIPEGALECESREILDLYVPATAPHPVLRLRKKAKNLKLLKNSRFPEMIHLSRLKIQSFFQ